MGNSKEMVVPLVTFVHLLQRRSLKTRMQLYRTMCAEMLLAESAKQATCSDIAASSTFLR